jgi:CBS domain-containing protein
MTDRKVIRVSDVMKTEYDMVDGLMSVSETLQMMKHVETKCVIVDKRHDDDAFGMVLISDVAREVLAKDRAPERVNVYEIMTKPVLTISPDMDIRYCARLFDQFGLSRAPVEKDGKILGIVSLTDMVLKGLCRHL